MTTSRAPAGRLPSRKPSRWSLLAWALLGCASLTAHAQTPPALVDALSVIGNGVAAGATGVVAINEAAGLDNAQANQGVITNGQVPLNLIGSSQSADTNAKAMAAKSTISSDAFSNTSGLIELNQSAGVGNLQRNSAVIGSGPIGAELVADGVLSATTAKGGGLGRSGDNHDVREVSIGADALKNVSGIVQINQAAGSGNVSSNSFVLRPPAGTFF
ncbi:hypothetical protein [Paraburkholderia phytofirmans]|uniref:Adhesin n=1 Tax=Paraburkholderia phytofirmans OLGA172 TaxID=1417228 RepID=A0A160FLX7_9BURK|nr:hypothetical protein [Paraburkholderia phytofirmans]ANB73501.1 hypothetical protein AYM40_14915 [Paraburkholderia phytofirmans OLGA172]